VETSNQHVVYLAGHGDIAEAVDMFQELKEGLKYTYDLEMYIVLHQKGHFCPLCVSPCSASISTA